MTWQIDAYTRQVSMDNGREIVEILWEPGSRTRKHGHNVGCTVRVVEGEIVEIKNGETVYHSQGSEFRERAGDIHIVCNPSGGRVTTRHVYEAELTMTYLPNDEQDLAALERIAAKT